MSQHKFYRFKPKYFIYVFQQNISSVYDWSGRNILTLETTPYLCYIYLVKDLKIAALWLDFNFIDIFIVSGEFLKSNQCKEYCLFILELHSEWKSYQLYFYELSEENSWSTCASDHSPIRYKTVASACLCICLLARIAICCKVE